MQAPHTGHCVQAITVDNQQWAHGSGRGWNNVISTQTAGVRVQCPTDGRSRQIRALFAARLNFTAGGQVGARSKYAPAYGLFLPHIPAGRRLPPEFSCHVAVLV